MTYRRYIIWKWCWKNVVDEVMNMWDHDEYEWVLLWDLDRLSHVNEDIWKLLPHKQYRIEKLHHQNYPYSITNMYIHAHAHVDTYTCVCNHIKL